MQLHTAYVTDKGDICLEIGGQNGAGGQTVSRVVYASLSHDDRQEKKPDMLVIDHFRSAHTALFRLEMLG